MNCVIVQDDGVKVRYCDRVIHIGAAVVIMVTILFQATKSLRP